MRPGLALSPAVISDAAAVAMAAIAVKSSQSATRRTAMVRTSSRVIVPPKVQEGMAASNDRVGKHCSMRTAAGATRPD